MLSPCQEMKSRYEITIDADQKTVWREYTNPDNLSKWQPALKSITHKTGTPGEIGATSELTYRENGRDLLMTATITEKRAPDFTASIYESTTSRAIVVNHFVAVDERRTRWISYANHEFKGRFGLRAWISRRALHRQSTERMQRFKLLVETLVADQTP